MNPISYIFPPITYTDISGEPKKQPRINHCRYQIEISDGKQTFYFPCAYEEEQERILEEIDTFLGR